MVLPTGWEAGRSGRRSGAAGCMARAALILAVGARRRNPMTVRPVSPIGWLAGARRRKCGAARIKERVASRIMEVALRAFFQWKAALRANLWRWRISAIFWCRQAMLMVQPSTDAKRDVGQAWLDYCAGLCAIFRHSRPSAQAVTKGH